MSNDSVLKQSLAALALRVTLGAILIYSGLEKIAMKDGNWGASWAAGLWQQRGDLPRGVQNALNKMWQVRETKDTEQQQLNVFRSELATHYVGTLGKELPAGLGYHGVQFAVAWGELLGGLALLLGLLVRLAALGVIAIQVGAVATVTWASGFSFAEGGGWGYNLAILGMCLAILCLGSGKFSLSFSWRAKQPPAPQPKEPPAKEAPVQETSAKEPPTKEQPPKEQPPKEEPAEAM